MAYIQLSSMIPQKREIVFDYITDMNKYISLLPSDISLSLVTPAPKMKIGVEYEFQIKRFGFSRSWTTKIDVYKKNEYFVECETSFVFQNWRHECQLQDHGDQNTLMVNHIEYTVGYGLFGKLVDDIWLRKDIKRIVDCAHKKLVVSV